MVVLRHPDRAASAPTHGRSTGPSWAAAHSGLAAVDPNLGQVYIAVGNPVPYNGNVRGPGEELFTESIVALNMNTGKYKWHYQEVHHDIWDYDTAANPLVALRPEVQGDAPRHRQPAKTGWVYILDRTKRQAAIGITEKAVPQRPVSTPGRPSPSRRVSPSRRSAAPRSWANWKAPDGNPVKIGCLFTPYNEKQYTVFAPSALGGRTGRPELLAATGNLSSARRTPAAWKALPTNNRPS